jgi:predicted AAA+ superfamily ATPase
MEAEMGPRSFDIPQVNRLDQVRQVVDALASGASTRQQLEMATRISARHVNYAVAAARSLGLVSGKRDFAVTALGSRLATAEPGSPEEQEVLLESIAGSSALRSVAPALLSRREPNREQLARRIERLAGLSPATAARRAQSLLAWRWRLRNPQGRLRLDAPAAAVAAEPSDLEDWLLRTPAPLTAAMVRDLLRDNPWWLGEKGMVLPAIRRDVVEAVRRRLRLRLAPIVVVRGPRQVGKTTAQQQVIEDLLAEGVPPSHILRLQCDALPELGRLTEPILRVVEWYERTVLRGSLNAAAHAGRRTYLFFDEVQNLSDWAVQLKHLVDNATTQVLVTGSSALRIEQGRDSLAGRITTIEAGTLTLREISAIRFQTKIPPALGDNGLEPLSGRAFWEELRRHGRAHAQERDQAFAAFSSRGGYPLVHKNPEAQWADLAAQLNETVIKRVIQHDLRVGDRGTKRDPKLLEELFRLACRYAGQAPSTSLFVREIQRALTGNVGPQRVRHYLDFLDRALLLRLVRPLELRLKKTRGEPKLCLADHGLRASWLQELVPLDPAELDRNPQLADLAGRLAESVVGAYLHTFPGLGLAWFPERGDEPEVDYILTIGPFRIPLEVKYRKAVDPWADTEGIRSFLEKKVYNAPFGILVTREEVTGLDDPRIVALPLSSFLLLR